MNQYHTERRLCLLYSLVAIFLLISVISIAIPYNHWQATLDVCPGSWLENTNCGCIFFGVSTSNYFNGGHNSNCMFAIFGPLPAVAYAILMAVFHMYRVCINNIGEYEDEKVTELEEIEGRAIVVRTQTRVNHRTDSIIYCWIPKACFAAVFALYAIIHAAFITHGFIRTCDQYRGYLVRDLKASGDQAAVILFRLTCSAVLDFMDYIQKDAPNSRRGEFINTGASLQIAIVASWISVALWIMATVLSSKRAHTERHVLTCCDSSITSVREKNSAQPVMI